MFMVHRRDVLSMHIFAFRCGSRDWSSVHGVLQSSTTVSSLLTHMCFHLLTLMITSLSKVVYMSVLLSWASVLGLEVPDILTLFQQVLPLCVWWLVGVWWRTTQCKLSSQSHHQGYSGGGPEHELLVFLTACLPGYLFSFYYYFSFFLGLLYYYLSHCLLN